MERLVANTLRRAFRKGDVGHRLSWLLGALVAFHLFLMAISPVVRLYTLAYMGNSEAMYKLGREYFKHPSEIVPRPNGHRGDYWLRKSAAKGNLHAIWYIEVAWGRVNPNEVVSWLHKGIESGHPWCAEQLARGHRFGLYGLKIDPQKEAEYRLIGERLRKEGKGSPDE